MELAIIILSEVIQTRKDVSCVLSHLWNLDVYTHTHDIGVEETVQRQEERLREKQEEKKTIMSQFLLCRPKLKYVFKFIHNDMKAEA